MARKVCILTVDSSQRIGSNPDTTPGPRLEAYILGWDLVVKYADRWTEFQGCMSHGSV